METWGVRSWTKIWPHSVSRPSENSRYKLLQIKHSINEETVLVTITCEEDTSRSVLIYILPVFFSLSKFNPLGFKIIDLSQCLALFALKLYNNNNMFMRYLFWRSYNRTSFDSHSVSFPKFNPLEYYYYYISELFGSIYHQIIHDIWHNNTVLPLLVKKLQPDLFSQIEPFVI